MIGRVFYFDGHGNLLYSVKLYLPGEFKPPGNRLKACGFWSPSTLIVVERVVGCSSGNDERAIRRKRRVAHLHIRLSWGVSRQSAVERCRGGKDLVYPLRGIRVNHRGGVVFCRRIAYRRANHTDGRFTDRGVNFGVFALAVKVHRCRAEAVLQDGRGILNESLRRIGQIVRQSPRRNGDHQVLDVHRLRILDVLRVVPAGEHIPGRAVGEDAVSNLLRVGRRPGQRGQAVALAVGIGAGVRADTADDDGVHGVLNRVKPADPRPNLIDLVKALKDVHPRHREIPRLKHQVVEVWILIGIRDTHGPGLHPVHIVLVAEAGLEPAGESVAPLKGGDGRLGGEMDAVVSENQVAERAVLQHLRGIVELDGLIHESTAVGVRAGLFLELGRGVDAVSMTRPGVVHITAGNEIHKGGQGHLPELQEPWLHILPRECGGAFVKGNPGGGIYREPCHTLCRDNLVVLQFHLRYGVVHFELHREDDPRILRPHTRIGIRDVERIEVAVRRHRELRQANILEPVSGPRIVHLELSREGVLERKHTGLEVGAGRRAGCKHHAFGLESEGFVEHLGEVLVISVFVLPIILVRFFRLAERGVVVGLDYDLESVENVRCGTGRATLDVERLIVS